MDIRKYCFSAAIMLVMSYATSRAQDTVNITKYWVTFKDKAQSAYSISRPHEFLSQRALDRRKKNHIAVTEQDLPVDLQYVMELQVYEGIRVINQSRWFNAVTLEVRNPKVIEQIRQLAFVTGVKYLGAWKVVTKPVAAKDQKGGLDIADKFQQQVKTPVVVNATDYGRGQNQIEMLNGIKMHQLGYTGRDVVIAVLDAGFSKANELDAFKTVFIDKRLLGVRDFVTHDGSVWEDDNHGMNVWSCIASNIPGKMIGTAPYASYWLLRSEDAASEFPVEEANWISAAEFADSAGADVINSSLGYTVYDDPSLSYNYASLNGSTSLISRAADIAVSKGIIVCNSAGNEGDSKWHYIGTPADAKAIISVGGVDMNTDHAGFSSYGPTVDGRIKPSVCAMAQGTIVASPGNSFYASNGTSFSSPVLTGMVACLVQANPDKTASQIIDAISKSGSHAASPDNIYGNGIPDFYVAHTILGNNKDFNYTKDQLMDNAYTTGLAKFMIRYYSATSQPITIQLAYKKSEGKLKSKAEATGQVNEHSFYCSPFIFNYLNNPKNLKKMKAGTYVVTITTGTATFTNTFEYTPPVKVKRK